MTDRMEQGDAISDSPAFLLGKQGARYVKHCAFSIQPQIYPNAVNYVSKGVAKLYFYGIHRFIIRELNFLSVTLSLLHSATWGNLLSRPNLQIWHSIG